MNNTYKQITFAEGYDKPFAEFKKEFQNVWVFRRITDKEEREKALKEAHKAATKKPEGNNSKKKNNGNASGSTKKVAAAKTK